jgi:hypothetical protein
VRLWLGQFNSPDRFLNLRDVVRHSLSRLKSRSRMEKMSESQISLQHPVFIA